MQGSAHYDSSSDASRAEHVAESEASGPATLELAFIAYQPGPKRRYAPNEGSSRGVRSQAAKSSAAARKATIEARRKAEHAIKLKTRETIAKSEPKPKTDSALVLSAGRSQLWHQILGNKLLYQATLFAVIAAQQIDTVNLRFAADLSYLRFGAIWARGQALSIVRQAITDGSSRQAAAAIALMASLEVKFGDVESYEAHMTAWRSLAVSAAVTGTGNEENHVLTLSDSCFDAVLHALKNANPPATKKASAQRLANESSSAADTNSDLQPGFAVFGSRKKRKDIATLLRLVSQFATVDLSGPDAGDTLRHFHIGSICWHPFTPRAIGGPAEAAALHSTWAVTPAIAGAVAITPRFIENSVFGMDTAEGITIIESNFRAIGFERALGTIYENVLLWATFTMCAISGLVHERCYRVLRRLFDEQAIITWEHMEILLRRHLYRGELQHQYFPMYAALTEQFNHDAGHVVWLSDMMVLQGQTLVFRVTA